MKFTYLGTAAAEAIPAFFCKCPICMNASLKKGREIRSRSQALVNEDLLIDFCPDTFYHMAKYDFFKLEDIKNIIITHSHSDHLDIQDISYIREGFAAIVDIPVNVYIAKNGYIKLKEQFERVGNTKRIVIHEIEPFQTYDIGKYKVTPLLASHDPKSSPVLYLIDDGIKTILYAHDTGYFPSETMDYLKNIKKPIDFISLDCTAFALTGWNGHHLSYDEFKNVLNMLKDINAINDKTIVVANHFSHNGHASYEDMVNKASKDNVLVSYDGMEINL